MTVFKFDDPILPAEDQYRVATPGTHKYVVQKMDVLESEKTTSDGKKKRLVKPFMSCVEEGENFGCLLDDIMSIFDPAGQAKWTNFYEAVMNAEYPEKGVKEIDTDDYVGKTLMVDVGVEDQKYKDKKTGEEKTIQKNVVKRRGYSPMDGSTKPATAKDAAEKASKPAGKAGKKDESDDW